MALAKSSWKVKNDIDYILSSKKNTIQDVNVLKSLNTGSDHRMVRSIFIFKIKLERLKLIKPNCNKIDPHYLNIKQYKYQEEIQKHMPTIQNNNSIDTNNKTGTQIIIITSKNLASSKKQLNTNSAIIQ